MKYRGIFINDEWPSFCSWATAKLGGINSKMYVNMFELLLRLKANYMWPAMWSSTFNEDDPMSPALADEYGIVMETSHNEPMMRSQKEYSKRKQEIGAWDFVTNSTNLEKFWFEGLNRNKDYENLITMSMRGDGDVAMGKGNDLDNMRWLDFEVDVKEPGIHTLKIIMIDPEIVVEKIVVNPDNKYPSYFGAPPVLHNSK